MAAPLWRRDEGGTVKKSRDGRGAVPSAGGLWLIVIAAVTLRLIAATLVSQSPLLIHPVLDDLLRQQRVIEVKEHGLLPTSLPADSPFYGVLIGVIPRGATPEALRVVQCVFEGLTTLLLGLWITRRFGGRAGLLAAALYALDPLGAVFAARFSPVVPATTLLVGALWLLDRERERGIADGVLLGLCLGFGLLLTPLPFLGVLVALLLWRPISATAPRAWRWAVGAPAALIVVGVLAVHTGLPDGGPVLGWKSGHALHQAFDPGTGGTPRNLTAPTWQSQGAIESTVWEALGREGTRFDLARFYAVRGLQRIVENPIGVVGVLLTKGAATVGAFPVPDALSPAFLLRRNGGAFAYGLFSFAFLVGLAAAGIAAVRTDARARCLLLGTALVSVSCLLGPTSAAARHLALPLLAGLGGIWLAAGARRTREFAVALITILASTGLGFLAPTECFRNPSEDLRLAASVFVQQQSGRQALGYLEEAVRVDPRNVEARVMLAQSNQRDGLIEAAAVELEKAFATDSTNAGLLLTFGRFEQSRQQPEAAVGHFTRLVNLRPQNPLYLNELGQVLMQVGQVAQAGDFFARALRLKPDYVVARQNLETVETYKRRLEESLFPNEERLGPDDPVGLAVPPLVLAMEQGDWARADSLITWMEAERPSSILPSWFRAAYLARRGDYPGAMVHLEACNRRAPGRPAIVQNLATMYVQLNRIDDAKRLIAEAMHAAGEDPERKGSIARVAANLKLGPDPGAP